jgi:hypothetical protein
MGGLLSGIFNFLANYFLSTKAVLYALFTLIIPVVLWNLWVEITEFLLSQLLSAFSGVDVPSNVGFSFSSLGSFAVWLAGVLRLPEAFVVFVSGLTIRVLVNFLMRLFVR